MTFFILFPLIVLCTHSCRTTKLLQEDELLLKNYKIKINNKQSIKKDDIKSYVKQKPNKSFFKIIPFKLVMYNTFSRGKRKIPVWITENMGEAPVIYDEFLTKKATENIALYLKSKGYYGSEVSFSNKQKRFNKQKIKTLYQINVGIPYRFRTIRYDIPDTTLNNIILQAKKQTLIKNGQLFDLDVLKQEQQRLTELIKNSGYYNFNKDYISFRADTTNHMRKADITISIMEYLQRNNKGKITQTTPHRKYKIDTTYITYGYAPQQALKYKDSYWQAFDTTKVSDQIYILHMDSLDINPKVILRSYFIKNGEYYNLDNETKTKQQLSMNKLFKIVNIQYKTVVTPDSIHDGSINCQIYITPYTLQSFTVELEGTNTAGDWGAEVSLRYTHKNLFHGAEVFSLKLNSAFETDEQTGSDTSYIFYSQEYGIDAKLEIPKFLFPIKTFEFDKKYRPKTTINVGYSFKKTIDYTKPVLYMSYGYFWLPNKNSIHKINLFDISGIRYYNPSERFTAFIEERDYYKYSYEDYYIYAINYTYTFSNQQKNKSRSQDFQYIKFFVESSGNILNSFAGLLDLDTNSSGSYMTFNVPYSQYVKADIDFRYYHILDSKNTTVYRIFIGAALPYGNSEALPSVKKYSAGGASSMRAWSVKQLGPGSYNDTEEGSYHYYLGDMKIEANIERRFPLFWFFEGALFVDMGNIWTIHEVDLEGSQFAFNNLLKDLAVGAGFGLRLDFSFLTFRIDTGLKIKDPAYLNDNNTHWIPGQRKYTSDDVNINIGIGYPF